jgi:hypothetical protein
LLIEFAARFERPEHGRYIHVSARADRTGILSLPAPVPDHTGRLLAVWAVAGIAGAAAFLVAQQVIKRREGTRQAQTSGDIES